jgi:hypothetical protein
MKSKPLVLIFVLVFLCGCVHPVQRAPPRSTVVVVCMFLCRVSVREFEEVDGYEETRHREHR